MNQHLNQDLMWKNPTLIQSTESKVRSSSDSKWSDDEVELKDFININSSCELYDCSANGNSFENKGYHGGTEKVDGDRMVSNSTFNQFNPKLTPISKVKEYKNYNDVDPASFSDGIYVQNPHFNNQSIMQNSPELPVNLNMSHQFDTNNVPTSKMRHINDQPITEEFLWFYLDPRNNVQGPFFDSQMFQWWSQGIYFQNSLFMKRKCDADFSTLQDYSKRFNGVPFNRKDIRVPPLSDSLTVLNPTNSFIDQKIYTANGPATHRNQQQIAPMNDSNYILQLLSSVPGQPSTEELSKLLNKVNIHQRQPIHQMVYEQPPQNGADPFMNNAGSSSLSNFVNLRLSNPLSQSQAYNADISSKTGHIANYSKTERFPSTSSTSWGALHQQKLTDSVWMSTTDDTILSSNPVWSRSTNDAVPGVPSLLSSIFSDSHQHRQQSNMIPNNSHLNPMQESWDNLDPAIIKIVPQGNSALSSADNKMMSRDNVDDQKSHISSYKSGMPDNIKHPWAELVRKGSSGVQISKTGFNSENDAITNHRSLSPNQHQKTSLTTSSSSDEYDQITCDSSDKDLESLIKWSKTYLENKPSINGVDIGTLIELLIYVESPYEVEATMRENVPEFDNICEFVKIFIEKRRPLRQKLFSDNLKKKSKSSLSKIDDDTKWQVKSKSHGCCKKKRKNTKN